MGDNGTGEQRANSAAIRNLTPYKPGQSGNPNGRPKGAKDGIVACLRRELKKRAPDKALKRLEEMGLNLRGKTNAHVIAAILTTASTEGREKALRMVLEYTEPKPRQALELTGADGGPVQVTVEDARARLTTLVDRLRSGAGQHGD